MPSREAEMGGKGMAEVSDLLLQGIAAARAGQVEVARQRLEEVIAQDADNEEAWLWLGSLAEDPQAKVVSFRRVLAINPANHEAQAGLALLEGEEETPPPPTAEPQTPYCTYHPSRTTLLRCSKCETPICPDCAIATPVGYRCRECAQVRVSPLYQVSPLQYLLASLAALGVSLVGAFVLALFPIFFLSFILGLVVGGLVAQAMDLATGHRRGRGLQAIAGLAIAMGVLALLLLNPAYLVSGILYAALAIATAVARLA
jgi:hypothetical protein